MPFSKSIFSKGMVKYTCTSERQCCHTRRKTSFQAVTYGRYRAAGTIVITTYLKPPVVLSCLTSYDKNNKQRKFVKYMKQKIKYNKKRSEYAQVHEYKQTDIFIYIRLVFYFTNNKVCTFFIRTSSVHKAGNRHFVNHGCLATNCLTVGYVG